ncbi:MAG: ABC transporter ATP-binding protein [Acidobacteria bacterium]|nr:ABC transporter ATP-binding protein [Acidobacteriota bacterium]MYG74696.1 ABC transporter ATP-binding protein [Acidobacteriota bacterium]
MLEARELTKSFGDVRALQSLNVRIGAGESLCLLGANGAGKTTTINLFLAFVEPTSGSALVNGHDVQRDPIGSKRHLAYIPEQVALYPSLTGLENLEFLAELSGHRDYGADDLLGFLERAGLDSVAAFRRVAEYSKGMRQKVAIAAALARRASAFLLDEPLSGLDPKAANEFTEVLGGLRSDGAAILLATHDIFRARELGTTIGIMRSGELVEQLDPASVTAAELEKIYLAHMRGVSGPGGST